MNKVLFFLRIFAVATICSLNLVACSNDDDDDDSNSSSVYVGNPTSPEEISGDTWVINYNKSTAYANMNGVSGPVDMKSTDGNTVIPTEFAFKSDGNVDVDVSGIKSSGNYSISGKEFSCTYKIGINKNDWDGTQSVVEKEFTLKKDADLTKVLYEELGMESDIMKTIFTQCEITKSGNQLILNLTMTSSYNMDDMDLSGAYEFGEEFGNLINNNMKSKKYVSYNLVYDKK